MRSASAGHWKQLFSTAVNEYVDYTLQNVAAGTFDLKFRYKTHTNRGIVSVSVDGTTIGATIDQYKSGAASFPEPTLGTLRFAAAGNHVVRLTVAGKRSAAGNHNLAADRFVLVPDTTAPVITSGDMLIEATGPTGAVVSYTAAAVDDKDGAVALTRARRRAVCSRSG